MRQICCRRSDVGEFNLFGEMYDDDHMVACICHLIFSATTHYFFKKILCCGKFVTTHYFLSHNTLFFQKILCCAPYVRNTIFFEKIMCCGKFVTTHYFLSDMQHIIFSKNIVLFAMPATQYFFEKNNVLWQVCRNTLFFETQHIIF